MPRTLIKETRNALKNHTKSFEVNIKNNKDPLAQMQNTRIAIVQKFKKLLNETNGFKFNETLQITFTKLTNDSVLYKIAYFNCKAKTIINENKIQFELENSQQEILNKIAIWVSEGSGRTVKSVHNHFINVVNYRPLRGQSYIQLPAELKNSSKGLINIKNNDNECFRLCHIRLINSQEKNPQRIQQCDKEYIQK